MTLDPQAAAHLAATATAPATAELDVPGARLAILGYLSLQHPAPEMAEVEHRFVPGPTADLPIRILRPHGRAEGGPVVVVLHGSGWVAARVAAQALLYPALDHHRDTATPRHRDTRRARRARAVGGRHGVVPGELPR